MQRKVFTPKAASQRIYERLYAEYHRLHDYFGRGENPVMKTLKALRVEQARRR